MSQLTHKYFNLDISQIKKSLPFIEGRCLKFKANNLQLSTDVTVFYTGKSFLVHYKFSEEYAYHISIIDSVCHLGGKRIWFKCPVSKCRKPVSNLYLKDEIFACRNCHKLSYQVQMLSKARLPMYKLERLEKRLKGRGSNGVPPLRPKGMHHKTYQHLCDPRQYRGQQIPLNS